MKSISFLSLGFAIYWAAFWLLNGLDKFFCGKSLFGFVWYGKDRTAQFGGYFERLNLPEGGIQGLLYFAGVVEIAVAVPFLLVVVRMARGGFRICAETLWAMHFALFLSFLVFIGFVIFDIIVGDRAELLEHSTYLIVIAATFLVTYLELFFQQTRFHASA